MRVAQELYIDSMNLVQESPTHNEGSPRVMSIFYECSSRVINPLNERSSMSYQLIIREFQEPCDQIQCKKHKGLDCIN